MKRIAGSVITATALALTGCQGPTQPDAVHVAALASAMIQVVPDHYIVVFTDQVADPVGAARGLSQAHGLGLRHTYTAALNGFAAVVPPGRIQALRNDPRVDYIEADLIAQAIGQTLPAGVDRIDADLNTTANIDGVDDRVDVDIAIIDTGIDLDHPDLNVVDNVNFNSSKRNGDDDNGHGTHVAGTAAALDNGLGVVGVAPGARLWAVKVLDRRGSGFFSDVIAGIDYVTANAAQIEVANMSLGGTGSLASLRTAIQNSVAAGVVYVVAAGNSSKDVYGNDGAFGTNDDDIPASYPEVAAISAMGDTDGQAGGSGPNTSRGTADDTFADFTNFSNSVVGGNPVTSSGAAIDLAAPGVDIRSTWKGGGERTISGTSMSSPHVAGAAALEAATNGRATDAAGVAAIRQTLIDAAEAQSAWGPANINDPDGNPEGLLDAGALAPAAPAPLDITTSSLPNGTVNEAYSATLEATGGTPSYSWEITAGALPAGLSLTSTWEILGTPTTAETLTFTVTVTDADNPSATDNQELSITIAAPPPLDITTTSLSDGTVNEAYSATLEATGGTLPYSWEITAGVLPVGLSLTTSGEILGTPTAEGPQTFTVKVTDVNAETDSQELSIVIAAAAQGDAVTITKAVYNSRKGELKVEATSSASTGNSATSPKLTITDIGGVPYEIDMTYDAKKDKYSVTVDGLGSKPGAVTVTSSTGGSATSDVGGR